MTGGYRIIRFTAGKKRGGGRRKGRYHFRANCSPLECGFAAVIDGPAVCVLSVLRVCCGVSNL